MEKVLSLRVSPVEFREFAALLDPIEERSFLELALGSGSRDSSKPRRAIEKFLEAGDIFGFAKTSASGAVLSPRGMRFRAQGSESSNAARASFFSSPVPASVLRTISTAHSLKRDQLARRLMMLGREGEVDCWVDWLAYAALIEAAEGAIQIKPIATNPLGDYLPQELALLQEEVYRWLASSRDADGRLHSIEELFAEFHRAVPEKSEGVMRRLIQAHFSSFGIPVQIEDGPREKIPSSGELNVQFGSEGEDAVGFFLRPPAAAVEDLMGFAIAMELKRKASDKKAVGQAVTAAGRWRAFYKQKVNVIPVCISDSETYSEKSAREYASSNNVVHLSLAAVHQMGILQMEFFGKGQRLINPVHVLALLSGFRAEGYIEPTTADVIDGLKHAVLGISE